MNGHSDRTLCPYFLQEKISLLPGRSFETANKKRGGGEDGVGLNVTENARTYDDELYAVALTRTLPVRDIFFARR